MFYIIGQYPPTPTGQLTSCDAASVEEAIKEFSERFSLQFTSKDVNGYEGWTDGKRDFLIFEGDEGVRKFAGMMITYGLLSDK